MIRDYHWNIRDRFAVLTRSLYYNVAYDSEHLTIALNTVKSRRADYATEEAWRLQVDMLSEGLALLTEALNTKAETNDR